MTSLKDVKNVADYATYRAYWACGQHGSLPYEIFKVTESALHCLDLQILNFGLLTFTAKQCAELSKFDAAFQQKLREVSERIAWDLLSKDPV